MQVQQGAYNPEISYSVPALSAAGVFGQAKVATTGTAVQLGSAALLNGVIICALSTNAAPIEIGTSSVNSTHDGTGNGYVLVPGAACSFAVTNTNVLYINGTGGDGVSFGGS